MNGLIFTSLMETWSLERPSGAYRIAHYLRAHLNCDVEVVDYLIFWKKEDLKELIKNRIEVNKIKWVGLSITWYANYKMYNDLCDLLKENFPELKILVGGQDIYYKYIDADYYINGYGEIGTVHALQHAFGNGKIVGTPIKKGWLINALHFYPAYPPSAVDGTYEILYEDRDFLEPNDVLTLEFQRGCKFSCKYCSYPILGVKGDTSRTQEDIYTELQRNYDKWGITNYAIADETINNNDEKLVKISAAVRSLSFKPNFTGFVRLDLLNSQKHHIDLLMESRVWGQYYGIESFNHETGKIIGKGLDPEKVKQTMLEVRDRFKTELGLYRGTASMIAGLPRESYQSLSSSVRWLKDYWRDQSWIFFPLSIHKKMDEQEGILKLSAFGEDFSKYGYKAIPFEEIPKLQGLDTFGIYDAIGLKYAHTIFWQNEHGDVAKAAAWTNSPNVECTTLDNWQVWGASTVFPDPIEDLVNGKTKYRTVDMENQIKYAHNGIPNKVSNYIKNKLALYQKA